jgi:hypothetical protein
MQMRGKKNEGNFEKNGNKTVEMHYVGHFIV